MFRIFLSFCCVFLFVFASAQAGYDKPYVCEQITYRTAYEDTFVHLARDYDLGFVELRAANPKVDPWLPGKNTKLILPMRHILPDAERDGIVINLPEMRLYAYVNGDAAPTTYPIGVGREGLDTPKGTTKVVRKKDGPTWRPTPRMLREDPELKSVYPPGPDNPLGTHALYLGWPTYALHGTNRPFGIGRRISSGCIRLYPKNIAALFEVIPVGTKVQVVDQPIKLAWIEDKLYIEAHPELEQALQMEEDGVLASPQLSEEDLKRIIKAAGAFEDDLNWKTIRKAVKERKGYPIKIGSRPRGFAEKEAEDGKDAAGEEDVAEANEGDKDEEDIDPKVKAIQDELTGAETKVADAEADSGQKSAGRKITLNP